MFREVGVSYPEPLAIPLLWGRVHVICRDQGLALPLVHLHGQEPRSVP